MKRLMFLLWCSAPSFHCCRPMNLAWRHKNWWHVSKLFLYHIFLLAKASLILDGVRCVTSPATPFPATFNNLPIFSLTHSINRALMAVTQRFSLQSILLHIAPERRKSLHHLHMLWEESRDHWLSFRVGNVRAGVLQTPLRMSIWFVAGPWFVFESFWQHNGGARFRGSKQTLNRQST